MTLSLPVLGSLLEQPLREVPGNSCDGGGRMPLRSSWKVQQAMASTTPQAKDSIAAAEVCVYLALSFGTKAGQISMIPNPELRLILVYSQQPLEINADLV